MGDKPGKEEKPVPPPRTGGSWEGGKTEGLTPDANTEGGNLSESSDSE